jgi:hypothetical protein
MTYAIGNEATLGIACLGITHPHTSGRVKAFLRMPNAKVLGAYDASPLLDPFVQAMVSTAAQSWSGRRSEYPSLT